MAQQRILARETRGAKEQTPRLLPSLTLHALRYEAKVRTMF